MRSISTLAKHKRVSAVVKDIEAGKPVPMAKLLKHLRSFDELLAVISLWELRK